MTDPLQVVGATVASKYEVTEFLGVFGPRAVYRGQHRAWGEQVRIEFLAPDGRGDPQAAEAQRRAFVRASAVVARLASSSSAIVQPRDGGSHRTGRGEAAYVVYEWIEGKTVAGAFAAVRASGARERYVPEMVVELFAPVLDAMVVAHKEGIVHAHFDHTALWVVGGEIGPRCQLKLEGLVEGAWRTALPGSSLPLRTPDPGFAAPELASCDATLLGPWTDVYGVAAAMAHLMCGSIDAAALDRSLPEGTRYAFEKALATRIDSRFKNLASFRASMLEGLASRDDAKQRNPRRTMVVSDVQSELSEGSAGGFEVSDEDPEVAAPPRGKVKAGRVRLAFTQPSLSVPEALREVGLTPPPATPAPSAAAPPRAPASNSGLVALLIGLLVVVAIVSAALGYLLVRG